MELYHESECLWNMANPIYKNQTMWLQDLASKNEIVFVILDYISSKEAEMTPRAPCMWIILPFYSITHLHLVFPSSSTVSSTSSNNMLKHFLNISLYSNLTLFCGPIGQTELVRLFTSFFFCATSKLSTKTWWVGLDPACFPCFTWSM